MYKNYTVCAQILSDESKNNGVTPIIFVDRELYDYILDCRNCITLEAPGRDPISIMVVAGPKRVEEIGKAVFNCVMEAKYNRVISNLKELADVPEDEESWSHIDSHIKNN
jgi:hypothetical protein